VSSRAWADSRRRVRLLFTQDPFDGIDDVAFATPVGTDDARDGLIELELGSIGEALKAMKNKLLQSHGGVVLLTDESSLTWSDRPELVDSSTFSGPGERLSISPRIATAEFLSRDSSDD
jgi:hypothetical protein